MTESAGKLRARTIKVNGMYYEYQEPRRDFVQVPRLRMCGYWILEAGFAIGDSVEVRVSKSLDHAAAARKKVRGLGVQRRHLARVFRHFRPAKPADTGV
ncbi:MAG: SymE family type I addiction module toxin [Betaproteobacteria bacterium]